MEKDKNIEWIKSKLNKGKDELVKLTKISKLRIEIASNKKKMDEKLRNLGLKVYQMKKEGEEFPETLDLDFENVELFENKIKEIENMINDIKASEAFEEDEDTSFDETDDSDENVDKGDNEAQDDNEAEEDEVIVLDGEVVEVDSVNEAEVSSLEEKDEEVTVNTIENEDESENLEEKKDGVNKDNE